MARAASTTAAMVLSFGLTLRLNGGMGVVAYGVEVVAVAMNGLRRPSWVSWMLSSLSDSPSSSEEGDIERENVMAGIEASSSSSYVIYQIKYKHAESTR